MEGGQGVPCPPSPLRHDYHYREGGGEKVILNKPVNKPSSLCREGGGERLIYQAFSLLVTPSGGDRFSCVFLACKTWRKSLDILVAQQMQCHYFHCRSIAC